MNINLATLPSDVNTLHRLVRDLAAHVAGDQSELAQARAEIQRAFDGLTVFDTNRDDFMYASGIAFCTSQGTPGPSVFSG